MQEFQTFVIIYNSIYASKVVFVISAIQSVDISDFYPPLDLESLKGLLGLLLCDASISFISRDSVRAGGGGGCRTSSSRVDLILSVPGEGEVLGSEAGLKCTENVLLNVFCRL